jgi:hypothetical protein
MAEKLNFLKKYPLIPSVFFILFAWFCLFLISSYKGTEKTLAPPPSKPAWYNFNELNVSGMEDEKEWRLKISNQDVYFESEDFGKGDFKSTQLIELKKTPENQVLIWREKNAKNTIEVLLNKDFKQGFMDFYINFNGKYFYQRSE